MQIQYTTTAQQASLFIGASREEIFPNLIACKTCHVFNSFSHPSFNAIEMAFPHAYYESLKRNAMFYTGRPHALV